MAKKDNPVLSRRNLLKTGLAFAMSACSVSLSGALQAHAAPDAGRKILIVYFSRSGNTRKMAAEIASLTGGDLVELKPAVPYPDDYTATTEQAKKELETGYKPELATRVPDIGSYDVVFVGSPSWWATLAPPVQSFLVSHDVSGKTLVPFITHGGSGLGNAVTDLRALCPGSTIVEGLAVRGTSVSRARPEIASWLQGLGFGQ